jgi:choline monooxygenase
MARPDDLFAAEHYAAVRRPVGEAWNLPGWCYTEAAFFAREIERIFRREWVFAAREEQIPAPGDYLALEIAGIPLLLVRAGDGIARAFANTCRHRGCLIAEGSGHARDFTCPYHSWLYSLKGELLSAPTEMSESVEFKLSDFGLLPIRLEDWGGFLWVNFAPDTPGLEAHLGNLPELLAPYACGDMRLGRRVEFDVPCNWKFYVENLKDAQHVTTVHRRSINTYASPGKYRREQQRTIGNVLSTFMGYPGSAALLAGDSGFPPIAGLEADRLGTTAPLVFPNLYISCTVDCAWYIAVHPVAVDRSRVEQGALFPRAVFDRPDFDEVAGRYFRRLDMTQEEDNDICARQHRGVASPYHRAGRYATRERLVRHTVNWILDRVLDP